MSVQDILDYCNSPEGRERKRRDNEAMEAYLRPIFEDACRAYLKTPEGQADVLDALLRLAARKQAPPA